MSFIRKIEEAAASKLKKLFLDAKQYADTAMHELENAEDAVRNAKIKAAAASEKAYYAAAEAAEKAQEVANQLLIEAKAAEEQMIYHKELLDKNNK